MSVDVTETIQPKFAVNAKVNTRKGEGIVSSADVRTDGTVHYDVSIPKRGRWRFSELELTAAMAA